MRKSSRIWRLILSLSLMACFGLLALFLYNKQQLKVNYLSFEVENAQHSFVVPDVDRLINKIASSQDLQMEGLHADVAGMIDQLIAHADFSVNRELAKECFVSCNAASFSLVLNTNSAIASLLTAVNEEFATDGSVSGNKITISGKSYFADHYGNYLVVSNQEIQVEEREEVLQFGNADYVVFDQETEEQTRHILSKKYHFTVWETQSQLIKGRPVDHLEYFESTPADFDELHFYGSSRMTEDAAIYFEGANSDSYAWLSEGLMYVRKGEHELCMAEQGEGRDLSLMLEEQTIQIQDTSEIAYFNIGKFKIMPFETDYNWTSSLSDLQSQFSFYTEYNNFNLMANSIPAMRWFLGEVQLGNLIGNHEVVWSTYNDCLPENSHEIEMLKDSTGGYICESRIYSKDSSCLISHVESGQNQLQMDGVDIVYEFMVEIVPNHLQFEPAQGDSVLILNNDNQVAAYSMQGEKVWKLDLSTALIDKPQIVDFDNNGLYELVLFQQDQIDVVDHKGQSLNGFPVKLGGTSKAGLAVNYDESYKWRLLVNVNNTVKVYSEEGKVVDGWMFKGMQAGIDGKIYHVITEGKDIITFKDETNFQHVLNRRGEYRLDHDVIFNLMSETDFVVGSLESALRKLGYEDGYIYNYYILDGHQDSVAIDKAVAPIRTFWEYNGGKPLLILEETDRLIIVNQFGYVQSEVLKPNQSNQFVGLIGNQDYGFVFADNSQNSIYLLNNFGKMMLPQAVSGSKVSIIEGDLLITYSGITMKAYKIAAQ